MKKTVLVAAVAAMFSSTALAQSGVTLYGIADAGIGWHDSGASGKSSTIVVDSGYHSASRFGIRGAEDLGNGLKAIFTLEAGFSIDTGAADSDPRNIGGKDSVFWHRRSVVGLAGRFGEIRLGRDYTPGFLSAVTTDALGYGLLGNWLTFQTGAKGITSRVNNGIHYMGRFNGITLRAMYADGEQVNPRGAGDIYGLSAIYAGGPITLQGYYHKVKDSAENGIQQFGFGGGYRIGAMRITLNYGTSDNDPAISAMTGIDKVRGLALGGTLKIGAGELLAQVIRLKADADIGGNRKGMSLGIGYTFQLSKRTNVYATYGMMSNDSNAAFPLFSSGPTIAPRNGGDDPKGLAVGIRHRF